MGLDILLFKKTDHGYVELDLNSGKRYQDDKPFFTFNSWTQGEYKRPCNFASIRSWVKEYAEEPDRYLSLLQSLEKDESLYLKFDW